MPFETICACGCGQRATGKGHAADKSRPVYKIGHGPVVTYRKRDGARVHRARAERALGKPLPPLAQVHHADGTTDEDGPLVICPHQEYHSLLHQRMRVRTAGGDPNVHVLCSHCHQLRTPSAMHGKWCLLCEREITHARRAALIARGLTSKGQPRKDTP